MENTPRSKASQGSPVENVLCNVDDQLERLGISEEYRKLLRDAGLPILCRVGRATIGLTGEIAEFLRDMPELGEPPSVARKARYIKRKQKPK